MLGWLMHGLRSGALVRDNVRMRLQRYALLALHKRRDVNVSLYVCARSGTRCGHQKPLGPLVGSDPALARYRSKGPAR